MLKKLFLQIMIFTDESGGVTESVQELANTDRILPEPETERYTPESNQDRGIGKIIVPEDNDQCEIIY